MQTHALKNPGYIDPAPPGLTERAWPAIIASLGIGAAAVVGGYVFAHRADPPKITSLPDGWFSRAVRDDDATWQTGAPTLTINAQGGYVAVRVIPEARSDFAVSFERPGDAKAFRVGSGRRDLTVEGLGGAKPGLLDRRACDDKQAPPKSPPTVTVHAPLSSVVRSQGPVIGRIERAENLQLSDSGCGRWDLAGADGRLWLAEHGSAQIAATSGSEVRAQLTAKGSVRVGQALRRLDSFIRGSGKIEIGRVAGGVDAEVRGSGGVVIASGFTGQANFFASKGGRIAHNGSVGRLAADAPDGGKVTVARVIGSGEGLGDVTFTQHMSTGDVVIKQPDAPAGR